MNLKRLKCPGHTPEQPRWIWQLRWLNPCTRRQVSQRIGFYALARDAWKPPGRGRRKLQKLTEKQAEAIRAVRLGELEATRAGLVIPASAKTRQRWTEFCRGHGRPWGLALEYYLDILDARWFRDFAVTCADAGMDPRPTLEKLLSEWVDRQRSDAPATWEALTEWYFRDGAPNAGARTRGESRTSFRWFGELCPELAARWQQLSADDARLFQVRLVAKQLESATVVKHLANMRKLWNAFKRSWVKRNPWTQLKLPKVAADPDAWHLFTAAEVTRLLGAAAETNDLRWQTRIRLAWKSGLRPGEIDHLRDADVDWPGHRARIHRHNAAEDTLRWLPKDKDARSIPLDQETVLLLQKLRARRGGNPYLFVTERRWRQALALQERGQWREDMTLVNGKARRWEQLVAAAKIVADDGTTEFYSLRKTCCCDCLTRGVPTHEVQALLGHADQGTTLKWYSKVNKEDAERRIRLAQDRAG